MALQHTSLYHSHCKKYFPRVLNAIEEKIQRKELLYTYIDKESAQMVALSGLKRVISSQEDLQDKKGVLWFVEKKLYTLSAISGSTLRLIGHIFLNVITGPFSRYNWYSCAKNG